MKKSLPAFSPCQTCFSASRAMISIEDRFFSVHRTILLAIGLWPYQKSKLAQLQLICCFSSLISLIVFQLTVFMTSNCTVELVITIFSLVFACITLVIKYNSFYVNAETVKYLLEQLQRIWDDLKDKNEMAIIEQHGNNAKRYAIILTIIAISVLSINIISHIWPDILHIILSVNNSQPRRLQIMTEYFVDQEKYFYLFFLHQNVTLCIGIIGAIGTGTMLMAYLQYACGMFQIASYRIKYAMKFHMLQDINLPHKILVYKEMIRAIDIHRKAMMFSTYLITEFEMSFMFMIIFGVSTLSLNILRLIAVTYNIQDLIVPFAASTLCIVYMFLANFIGQQITDNCDYVFTTAYEIQWYIVPLYTQKLILFLLQRGNKTYSLHVGGLFVASLECFAMLVNASVSYFTVMYSTR